MKTVGFIARGSITLVRTLCFVPSMILESTLWRLPEGLSQFAEKAQTLLMLLLIFCFWQGIRSVKQKTGFPKHTTSAAALFVFFLLISVLAWLPSYVFPFLLLPSIVAFFLILYYLGKLAKEMEHYGYAVQVKPVQLSDLTVTVAYGVLLITGIAFGYLFANQFPMNWAPIDEREQIGTEAITESLIEKGFPAHIIPDLTREDIIACKDAVQVVVKSQQVPFNEGRQVEVETNAYQTVFDIYEVEITQVAVALSGKAPQWSVFNHFNWSVNPDYYGTEVLQVLPSSEALPYWQPVNPIDGRVLYDNDGKTYTAPFHRLANENVTQRDPFFNNTTANAINAEFSLPKNGEQYRGYVSYSLIPTPNQPENAWITTSINYVHQKDWFQYPVRSAYEFLEDGISFSNQAFTRRHEGMYFSPDNPEDTLGPTGKQW